MDINEMEHIVDISTGTTEQIKIKKKLFALFQTTNKVCSDGRIFIIETVATYWLDRIASTAMSRTTAYGRLAEPKRGRNSIEYALRM